MTGWLVCSSAPQFMLKPLAQIRHHWHFTVCSLWMAVPSARINAWFDLAAQQCFEERHWEVAARLPEAAMSHRSGAPLCGHLIKFDMTNIFVEGAPEKPCNLLVRPEVRGQHDESHRSQYKLWDLKVGKKVSKGFRLRSWKTWNLDKSMPKPMGPMPMPVSSCFILWSAQVRQTWRYDCWRSWLPGIPRWSGRASCGSCEWRRCSLEIPPVHSRDWADLGRTSRKLMIFMFLLKIYLKTSKLCIINRHLERELVDWSDCTRLKLGSVTRLLSTDSAFIFRATEE